MHTIQDSDIATFERDGVVCLRSVLTGADIADLKSAINESLRTIGQTPTGYDVTAVADAIWRDGADIVDAKGADQYDLGALAAFVRSNDARPVRDADESSDGHFLLDTGVWMRSEAMRRVALSPVLPKLAGQLLNAAHIRFYDDQIFVKEPGTVERTAFHQDLSYFHVDGDQGCVMWIAVDGANRQTGTLGYVRGSHRWPATYKANLFTTQLAFPGTEGEQLPDIDNNEDLFDIVYFDVEPGDVIIHHFRTIHGSHGNASTSRTRRAASLRYVGERVRFCRRPGIPAQPHRPLDWTDGTDLRDPWFPLVWQRSRPAIAA